MRQNLPKMLSAVLAGGCLIFSPPSCWFACHSRRATAHSQSHSSSSAYSPRQASRSAGRPHPTPHQEQREPSCVCYMIPAKLGGITTYLPPPVVTVIAGGTALPDHHLLLCHHLLCHHLCHHLLFQIRFPKIGDDGWVRVKAAKSGAERTLPVTGFEARALAGVARIGDVE